MSRYCVVFVTAPAGAASRQVADHLLKKRLAACVNTVPAVASRYWWKGKIESARESLLIIKTRSSLFPKLIREVRRVHPYSVPEIIALPILKGSAAYLAWLSAETR